MLGRKTPWSVQGMKHWTAGNEWGNERRNKEETEKPTPGWGEGSGEESGYENGRRTRGKDGVLTLHPSSGILVPKTDSPVRT